MDTTYKLSLSADDSVELQILDYIGSGGVELKQVIQDLAPHKGKKLNVLLNSGGGSVFEGVAIYNFLKLNFASVKTEILGYGASIASILFLAGTERVMREGTLLFLHKPWTVSVGNANDLEKEIEALNQIEEQLISIYESNSALTREEIKAMLDAETWVDAQAASDYGFATEVDKSASKVAASIDKDFMAKHPILASIAEEQVLPEPTNSNETENVPPETRETKENLMEGNSNVSASTELNIQNSVEVVRPVASNQKFKTYKEFLNAVPYNSPDFIPVENLDIGELLTEENVFWGDVEVATYVGEAIRAYPNKVTVTNGTRDSEITVGTPQAEKINFGAKYYLGGVTVNQFDAEEDFAGVVGALGNTIAESVGEKIAEHMASTSAASVDEDDPIQGFFSKAADKTSAAAALTADEAIDFLSSLPTKYHKGGRVKLYTSQAGLAIFRKLADTSKKIDFNATAKTINDISYVITDLIAAPAAGVKFAILADLKRYYSIGLRKSSNGGAIKFKKSTSEKSFNDNLLFALAIDGKIVRPDAARILALKA